METNLAHVKIGVGNVEKSLKWYADVLEFEIDRCYPEENPTYYDLKGIGACFAIGSAENGNIYHGGRINLQTKEIDLGTMER